MLTKQLEWLAVHGGTIILGLLLVASIVSIGLFIERVLFFRSRFLSDPERLVHEVERAKDIAGLRALLKRHVTVETAIVLRAVEAAVSGDAEFRNHVEGYAAIQRPTWERFTGIFAWISSSAPLAGLLGTVLGLMRSFSDLAFAEIPEPRDALAGISDALLTTAFGIVVAIPATAFFNSCRMRARRAASTVDSLTSVIESRRLLEQHDGAAETDAQPSFGE